MNLNNEQQVVLVNILKELDDSQIMTIHNEYCDKNRYENMIYEMDFIDELLYGNTASEILNSLSSSFDKNDSFIVDGIYGLKSYTDIAECVDFDELAIFLIENGDVDNILEANNQELYDEFINCACEFANLDDDTEFREFLEDNLSYSETYEMKWFDLYEDYMEQFKEYKNEK